LWLKRGQTRVRPGSERGAEADQSLAGEEGRCAGADDDRDRVIAGGAVLGSPRDASVTGRPVTASSTRTTRSAQLANTRSPHGVHGERERRQPVAPDGLTCPRLQSRGDAGARESLSFERTYTRRPSVATGPPSGPVVGAAAPAAPFRNVARLTPGCLTTSGLYPALLRFEIHGCGRKCFG